MFGKGLCIFWWFVFLNYWPFLLWGSVIFSILKFVMIFNVEALTLGLQPRQRFAKVRAKNEAREPHFMLLRVQESVREWTSTLLSELPLWELESQWTIESSKNDYRGQNTLDWRILYIIENLLEFKCLKWVHMTHSST